MDKTQVANRRNNGAIEDAVREGKAMSEIGDYAETLILLSQRGVPKRVIERIFVYRQCCRSTDIDLSNKRR